MTPIDIHLGQTLKIGDVEITLWGQRAGVIHVGVKSNVPPVLLRKPPRGEPCSS